MGKQSGARLPTPLPRLPGAGKRENIGIESLRELFLLPSNPSPALVAPCLFTHYRGPRNAATHDKPGWTLKVPRGINISWKTRINV